VRGPAAHRLAAGLALALLVAAAGASQLHAAAQHRPRYAVGLRVMRIVDPSREIRHGRGAPQPRTLVTSVWYPAAGPASRGDVARAAPASSAGPFPLVVFGHGFAVRPSTYRMLLHAWAEAGYVVAAPAFPRESPDAPGGPQRADVVNEPRDMSVVVSALLRASADRTDPLTGLIAADSIAVAGHSDGAMAALAAAYGARLRDPRIRAAVILSGARMAGVGGFAFRSGTPPLLAVQGTADGLNAPRSTDAYFTLAARPKYLLRLVGAGHLAPYVQPGPWLTLVTRMSIGFLDRYAGRVPGARVPAPGADQRATLVAAP